MKKKRLSKQKLLDHSQKVNIAVDAFDGDTIYKSDTLIGLKKEEILK